ncbi:ATP-binding cassette domain-containing protein [Novosphingobium sp. MW5]|nr:ATP-binding cassette domain-containing protein [Novosphingobium sp. MW5]
MPAYLTLDRLTLATPGGRPLFSDLSLTIGKEVVGLVGRNGCGKSSLLRAILGEQALQSGAITICGTVGVLRQLVAPGEGTVADALGIASSLARLDRIEAGSGSEADFAEADWELPQRLNDAFAAAGLASIDITRPLDSLSGGERTRIGIAGLLLEPPELLFLDEPTNNLDQDGRGAIAALLSEWRGGALVASHDRELLEAVDRIVSLSPTGIAIHGGGWSSWLAERDAARARAAAERESADRQVREAQRAAQVGRERQARRDRAGRDYAASGSAPKILMGRQRERAQNSAGRGNNLADQRRQAVDASLEAAKAKIEVAIPLTMQIPPSGLASNRLVLSFRDVCWNAGERWVIDQLSFELRGPERVAITGRNGAGKTSLFRLAAGLAVPTIGQVERPVPLAMLDQGVTLLDRNATLAENMRRLNPALLENRARATLARFAFRNVEADKLVRDLSGGECLRAGLACVMSADPAPQLLMLDEPTNHMDLESIEVIEEALCGFDGALMVISHDSSFLDAIGCHRRIRL